MKNFFSVAAFSKKLKQLVKRMPLTLLLLAGLVILLGDFVYHNEKSQVSYRLWIFLLLGFFISISVTLGLEKRLKKGWLTHLFTLIAVLLCGLYCFFLPNNSDLVQIGTILQIVSIGVAAFLAIFFISFLKKEQDTLYWEFSKRVITQSIIGGIFAGIIFGGVSLALVAVCELFSVPSTDAMFEYLAILCWVVFFPLYVLVNIPMPSEKMQLEMNFNKLLKILGLYIVLPILTLYALILYVYLIKIIVTWTLPNGMVSWLVSILSIGGLALIMLLYPLQKSEHRLVGWLSRYMGLLLLPLLILMTIGIVRRICDYGITINRCYVLLLNIWFYGIYIFLFCTKSKYIKWIIISPALIFLMASVGNWSVANITKKALVHKMEKILDGKQLSINEPLVWLNSMDSVHKAELHATMAYLYFTYNEEESLQPFFKDSIKGRGSYNIIDNLVLNNNEEESSWFNYDSEPAVFSVEEYKTGCYVSIDIRSTQNDVINWNTENNQLEIEILADNSKAVFSLKEFVLQEIDDKKHASSFLLSNDNNYQFYIINIRGNYHPQQETIEISALSGILFYKP